MNSEDFDDPDDAIAAASRLEAKGDWTAAIDLYRHAAQRWPEQGEYLQHCVDRVTEKVAMAQTAQDDACRALDPTQQETAESTTQASAGPPRRGIRGTVLAALILLTWDVAFTGSFLVSFLVCPVWFLLAIAKNAIERPGWRLALLRIAIPPLVLWLVLANDKFERGMAKANAARIIAACNRFRVDNGVFPQSLDELVPRHMESVPPAKYCLMHGEFQYWRFDGGATLVWCVVPPFSRAIYDFEKGQWRYLD